MTNNCNVSTAAVTIFFLLCKFHVYKTCWVKNDNVSCNVPDDVSRFPVIYVAYASHKFFSAGVKGHADYLAWCYMGKVYVKKGHILFSRMNHNLTNTDTNIR